LVGRPPLFFGAAGFYSQAGGNRRGHAMSNGTATAPARRATAVLDSTMAHVESGAGRPIVFLHGNPTSSHLWRNVMPHLAGLGRCLAPDLIGMGRSGKNPAGHYRFVDHARYLDAWLEAVGVARDAVLVVHDWGSALGFDWARRHPERVRGIAYMEAIVAPLAWVDWPENARGIFQAMRSPAGEELVLKKNVFVERILPASILRTLSPEEHDAYRRPFAEPGEARRPTLAWPREIPIDGEPADVAGIVARYGAWLAESPVAKLFVNAAPGSILTGRQREICRAWPNQTEVTVKGAHFIQEDSPDEIGRALADFVRGLDG
jgi:haloalkane dehalogenase